MDTNNSNDTDHSGKQSTNLEYFALILCFMFAGGISFVFARQFPQTILTSFFFGMAGETTVYRFLGGFGRDDLFSTKMMKFSGAVAALLGITVVLNTSLQSQIDKWIGAWDLGLDVSPKPENLLILDGDGNLQKLVVKIKNREDLQVSIEPKRELLEKFVELCWTNSKACLPRARPVKISVKPYLQRGEGEVCNNQAMYSGLPISLRKGTENFVTLYISNDRNGS